ncbi:50S ribosomal protein L4 [Patescibacteria group bacterium]|nr:50S ribosomal protein L4 [Patescibacteria group bacterium]
MKVKVYTQNLEAAGETDLNPKIFEVKPSIELVQQAVRVQMNNSRQVSANTKTRGEVRGGGKKPWKQKGTGNARAGSIRSPLWRHGGVTFGPRANRNFELKMNKKQWRKALYMVLSDKAAGNNVVVFSDLSVEKPKTSEMVKLFRDVTDKVVKDSKKFLLVLPKNDENLRKSTRNLKNAKAIAADSLNIIDILSADALVVPQASLPIIEKTYLKV